MENKELQDMSKAELIEIINLLRQVISTTTPTKTCSDEDVEAMDEWEIKELERQKEDMRLQADIDANSKIPTETPKEKSPQITDKEYYGDVCVLETEGNKKDKKFIKSLKKWYESKRFYTPKQKKAIKILWASFVEQQEDGCPCCGGDHGGWGEDYHAIVQRERECEASYERDYY